MTKEDREILLEIIGCMTNYGDGFVEAFGKLLSYLNEEKTDKLIGIFPDVWNRWKAITKSKGGIRCGQ